MNYGVFINTIISFIIVAFAVFMVIRNINKLKREEEPTPAPEVTTKKTALTVSRRFPLRPSAARTAPPISRHKLGLTNRSD